MSHTPSDTTPSEPTFDRATLVKLLVAATALRDELDRTLQGSDALHDRAEALGRTLLGGHSHSLLPLMAQLQTTSASLKRATIWLACVEQNLTVLNTDPAGPTPPQPGLGSPVVEGLLALIDGLALLTPWGQTSPPAHQHLRATRACVDLVIQAALRGEALAPALADLTEQQSRLLGLGGPAQHGARRLGEAIEELLLRQT